MKRFLIFLAGVLLPSFLSVAQQTVIKAGTGVSATLGTSLATSQGITNSSANTDLKNLRLVMTNSSLVALTSSTDIELSEITMKGSAVTGIRGTWTVNKNITLTSGHIYVSKANANDQLIYTGTSDLAEGSNQSFIGGAFYMVGTGTRTFPIGNADGYFPVRLDAVKDKDVMIGFEVVKGDPNLDSQLPVDISEVLKDRYWELTTKPSLSSTTSGGRFTGSPISVSTNQLANFIQVGDNLPQLVELDTDGLVKNLAGVVKDPYLVVSRSISSKGTLYAIGKKAGDITKIEIAVAEVMTPNADNKNDALYVENISLFPENTVTLLDRYGVKVKQWQNFQNGNTEFDFSTLGPGNYVCIVEYTDPNTQDRLKTTQMVTVLK